MKIDVRLKILLSLILLVGLGLTYYAVSDQTPKTVNTEEGIGEIQFQLYNEFDEIQVDDELVLYEDDTLFTILNRHYDLVCANQHYQPDDSCSYQFLYGYIVLGIENVETNWYGDFLSIYVNGKVAVKGVSGIYPKDGDVIEIKVISVE